MVQHDNCRQRSPRISIAEAMQYYHRWPFGANANVDRRSVDRYIIRLKA